MWTATQDGYFSAVQHRDKPDTLMVRARDSKDLQHIRDKGYETGRIIAMTNATIRIASSSRRTNGHGIS